MLYDAGVWDVGGPVQAEVFVVWLDRTDVALTGPCGAEPWYLEVGADEHPLEVVTRATRDVLGEPLLAHSTSWRRDRAGVVLSFVVVIGPEQVAGLASTPVGRAELARSGATAAPAAIGHAQVLEHGLRHLAWLASEDAVVRGTLPQPWRDVLATYVPEPFRSLG